VDALGSLGLPLALNHGDLHGRNVFRGDGGALRFFDWGDAMLTDPTGVLLVPLRMLADALGCGLDDPRLATVVESWVEVWSDVAPAEQLRAVLPDALRVARVARHESWLRVTTGMTAAERAAWAAGPTQWLVEVADPG
jgi:hypothetical protein